MRENKNTHLKRKKGIFSAYYKNTKIPNNICFGQVLFLWSNKNKLKLKKSTQVKYDYLINRHILPALGKIPLLKITQDTLDTFIKTKLSQGGLHSKEKLSASYVRIMVLIISSALKYAEQTNLCPPLNLTIYKPIQEKREITVLSQVHQQILEHAIINDLDITGVGVLISLYTGLRIGEICALSWNDIDLEQKIIHVRSTVIRVKDEENKKTLFTIDKPKTRASLRHIPIPSNLYIVLLKMKEVACSQYVVSNLQDFVNPRTFEYRFHKLFDKLSIPSINFHTLRHTFATRCVEAGVDVKTLSEILGHSNVSLTLNTYVHSSMELKRKQLEKLVASLSNQ